MLYLPWPLAEVSKPLGISNGLKLEAYVQAGELSPKYSSFWRFTSEIFRNTVTNVVLSTPWIANKGYVYVLFTFACLSCLLVC